LPAESAVPESDLFAGESPCASLALMCSAAEVLVADAHRATPFAGAPEGRVGRPAESAAPESDLFAG
jgi:hypothetical protein